jgi:hypothetical protein
MSAHNALQEVFNADKSIRDPGNGRQILVDRLPAAVSLSSGASAQTRTLAAPRSIGDSVTLSMAVDGGGDITVTFTYAINAAGNTILTFNDVGDWVRLEAILVGTALRWRVIGSDGAALSGP